MAQQSSICWLCSRAYALPDPEGCGFHRKEHDRIYRKAEERLTSSPKGNILCITVLECDHFEVSMRAIRDSESAKKAKNWKKNGRAKDGHKRPCEGIS